jgi:hypothetical protein
MDTAYHAAAIFARSEDLGHVAVIDPNFRAQQDLKAEWASECERRKLIAMPDPDDALYDFRTHGRTRQRQCARFVRVRGAIKVKCHLMFGILALTVDQIFRATAIQEAAE